MFCGSTGRRAGVREEPAWLTGGMKVELVLMGGGGGGGFIPPSPMKGKLKFCVRCWSGSRLPSPSLKRTMLLRRASPPD